MDHRTVVNGILWILKTGAPWRDLPERYGKWQTVASRFYRWRKDGIWRQIFAQLQQMKDRDGAINWQIHYVDGTVIRRCMPQTQNKQNTLFLTSDTPKDNG